MLYRGNLFPSLDLGLKVTGVASHFYYLCFQMEVNSRISLNSLVGAVEKNLRLSVTQAIMHISGMTSKLGGTFYQVNLKPLLGKAKSSDRPGDAATDNQTLMIHQG